jgi:hypothetical protein
VPAAGRAPHFNLDKKSQVSEKVASLAAIARHRRDCHPGILVSRGGIAVTVAFGDAQRMRSALLVGVVIAAMLPRTALAGNDANFVLYDHHTAKKGETEINIYNDISSIGHGEEDYAAQLFEIERGMTDYWTTAVYFEGVHIEGDAYEFGGLRFENRVRLFGYGTFLNPVLYAEYEDLKSAHRSLQTVTGRTDAAEEEEGESNAREEAEEETEHDIETRLILGHDFSDRFNVAFNWINEANLDTGKWEFGYATGLNYIFYEAGKAEGGPQEGPSWDLEKLTLGLELYGGLGDSVLGLTFDPGKTQQYLGVNLQAEWDNHLHAGVGGAFGLTNDSESAILRLMGGYEFE